MKINTRLVVPMILLAFVAVLLVPAHRYREQLTDFWASNMLWQFGPPKFDVAAQRSCTQTAMDERDRELWEQAIAPYLAEDLWTDRDAYDAGHFLMVPLQAAFTIGSAEHRQNFVSFFERFAAYDPSIIANDLNRAQFLYLASRFVALSAAMGKRYPELEKLVENQTVQLWNSPAWMWDREPFANMRDRLRWKLTVRKPTPPYQIALFDDEMFVMATAADLIFAKRSTSVSVPQTLTSILDTANLVFDRAVTRTNRGTWLLQPGAWSEHPEYAFAGNQEISPGMIRMPVAGIASDTSHSHRLPYWLDSLANAQTDQQWLSYYSNLKAALAGQLIRDVLVEPSENFSAWRTNNFLDGNNGVYRWDGTTGYGPYDLSATFYLGWWSKLNSEELQSVYKDAAARFPMSIDIAGKLSGPLATREQNRAVKFPAAFQDGMIELLVRLAAKLC